jgi:RNA polymerase sigma factor (sigma-70 family)
VEASALHAPPALARLPLGLPLLKLRTDEQLLALFRAGRDEAFGAIHDRYRQRLFAYVRQMLGAGPRHDAEDVLQDVFVRAYGALRADAREVNLRAWLYRVAHNRCVDHLRRPVPPAADVFELSRKPLHDPIEEAQRREDLARLVQDVGRLPEQQRSALLMREMDGMSYADLAVALDATVPAVKSLLVRARIGLVEAAEARDADCAEIRVELTDAHDRGVKASGRARRHMRSCAGCREYRVALRGMSRSFAALSPVAAGPLAMAAAKLLGLSGAGGGAAAGGSAAAGGGAAAATVATVSACKVAAVVCTAAITAGGAVEVTHLARHHRDGPPRRSAKAAPGPAARAPVRAHAWAAAAAPVTVPAPRHRSTAPAAPVAPAAPRPAPEHRGEPARKPLDEPRDIAAPPPEAVAAEPSPVPEELDDATAGGAAAPDTPVVAPAPTPAADIAAAPSPSTTESPPPPPAAGPPAGDPETPPPPASP